jgi:hypothetical protein
VRWSQSTIPVEKIESSAEALRVRHHPIFFPPGNNFASNAAQVTGQTIAQNVASTQFEVNSLSVQGHQRASEKPFTELWYN